MRSERSAMGRLLRGVGAQRRPRRRAVRIEAARWAVTRASRSKCNAAGRFAASRPWPTESRAAHPRPRPRRTNVAPGTGGAMDRLRTLVGITIFWVVLSLLGDGFATLVVPVRLSGLVDPAWAASVIGLVTFVALIAGMVVQPLGGALSDALYPRWGRRGSLAVSALLIVGALAAFGAAPGVSGVLLAFVLLTVAASLAQAVQQGFLPDRIEPRWRGRAAGAKGLADLGG